MSDISTLIFNDVATANNATQSNSYQQKKEINTNRREDSRVNESRLQNVDSREKEPDNNVKEDNRDRFKEVLDKKINNKDEKPVEQKKDKNDPEKASDSEQIASFAVNQDQINYLKATLKKTQPNQKSHKTLTSKEIESIKESQVKEMTAGTKNTDKKTDLNAIKNEGVSKADKLTNNHVAKEGKQLISEKLVQKEEVIADPKMPQKDSEPASNILKDKGLEKVSVQKQPINETVKAEATEVSKQGKIDIDSMDKKGQVKTETPLEGLKAVKSEQAVTKEQKTENAFAETEDKKGDKSQEKAKVADFKKSFSNAVETSQIENKAQVSSEVLSSQGDTHSSSQKVENNQNIQGNTNNVMQVNVADSVRAQPSEQLIQSLRANVTGPNQQIQIRLNPQELGWVNIRFQTMNGEISGIIETEKLQTRYDIEKSLPEIAGVLQNCGVSVRNVTVISNTSNNPNQQGNQPDTPDLFDHTLAKEFSDNSNKTDDQKNSQNPGNRGINDQDHSVNQQASRADQMQELVGDDEINIYI